MPFKRFAIYHVHFSTQYLLTDTILRFHEQFETRQFKGTTFDPETFRDWYAKRYGNFTYHGDFLGFAFKSTALEPFRAGHFKDLSRKEKSFLKKFDGVPEPFVIIATTPETRDAIPHEFVHALDYLFEDFRNEAYAIIDQYDTRNLQRALLERAEYPAYQLKTEILAYVLTGLHHRGANGPGIPALRKALKRCMLKHFGFQLPGNPKSEECIQFCIRRMYNKRFGWKSYPKGVKKPIAGPPTPVPPPPTESVPETAIPPLPEPASDTPEPTDP
jgi:hypothetical protein